MNDVGKRYLIEQLNKHDERRGSGGRYISDRRYDNRAHEDFEDSASNYNDRASYNMDAKMDYRMDNRYSSRDFRGDMIHDYHGEPRMKLTKTDINAWKHHMQNTDGTIGEHYNMQQVIKAAETLGIRFRDFDEREYCLAVNMFYSDYGHLFNKWFSNKDDALMACAEMALAYLDDPDGVDASEKLAITYHCLTNLG